MNEWFAGEWAGVSQTFQVTRRVKRRQRKLLELDARGGANPSQHVGKTEEITRANESAKSAKAARTNKKAKKRVRYVEETSQQVVYGLTNFTPTEAGPEAVATFLRDHWAVENRLHWRRDVTLREDHSQVRLAGRPEVLAVLNNVVLALLDWLGVGNVPEQMRIFSAFPR